VNDLPDCTTETEKPVYRKSFEVFRFEGFVKFLRFKKLLAFISFFGGLA